MLYDKISLNGKIIPAGQAIIPFTETEVEYGFGVYETVKKRSGKLFFVDQHIERLFYSAVLIGLEHDLQTDQIKKWIVALVDCYKEDSLNLKIILQGRKSGYDLAMIPSAPLYPKKQWYRDGVKLCSFGYERFLPQAKTLNMLPSYIYYKKAMSKDCYDGLFIDKSGNILEGSRTNFFAIKDKIIFSPPKEKILEGVTLMSMIKILDSVGFSIRFQNISLDSLSYYEGFFLTSTSSKILPVSQIDEQKYPVSLKLQELIRYYDQALDLSNGDFDRLLDFAKNLE